MALPVTLFASSFRSSGLGAAEEDVEEPFIAAALPEEEAKTEAAEARFVR